jgi:hypothetical protein
MSRPRWLLVIALVGAFLRIAPALRDLDTVDRIFVPDDTYYTLTISRSLAHGEGPTLDGETRTSGFQPLLAFVTAPVFLVTDDPDVPLRFVILLGALADVLSILLLARLARRVAGDDGALIAAALWAASPVAVANALGGLETAVSLCLQLALVDAWCAAREHRTHRRYVVAGVLAGLALLGRVDSAFLVAALGALELWNGDRRRLGLAVVAAVVVVAPWWGYSIAVFGSPVPESGAAVRDIVGMHRELYLRTHMAVGWAAGTVVGAPMLDLGGVREWLFDHAAAAWALWIGTVAVGGVATVRWFRGRDASTPIAMLVLHAAAILAFYTFVVSALWFFRRYLAPVECVVALLIAIGLARAWGASRHAKLVAGTLGAGILLLGLIGSARFLFVTPATSPDTGLHGAKGYREAVRDVFKLAPRPAVIGAFQSGALAYYAPAGVRVLNLDGVVDHVAAQAGRDRKLADYARARGMTHLADWKFNLDTFVRLSRASTSASSVGVRSLGTARSQGPGDQFRVLQLEWR